MAEIVRNQPCKVSFQGNTPVCEILEFMEGDVLLDVARHRNY